MQSVRLLAVGDISLRAPIPGSPFAYVEDLLTEKDVLFGNLETVLSETGTAEQKAYLSWTEPGAAVYLQEAGFDLVNLANNHILDRGPEGLAQTLGTLNERGLTYIGAGRVGVDTGDAAVERGGVKLGFLGYTSSGTAGAGPECFVNKLDPPAVIRDIQKLRRSCDVVVVSVHWGGDDFLYPSPNDIELAHRLVDAGASLVVGHHSHVLQAVEEYQNGLIAYSLGNFQFLGGRSPLNRMSMVLSVGVSRNGLESYSLTPVTIDQNLVPHVADDQDRQDILTFVSAVTEPVVSGRVTNEWWYRHIAWDYLVGNMASWLVRTKRYGLKHLLLCLRWLVSPFVIRCYLGLLMRVLKGSERP